MWPLLTSLWGCTEKAPPTSVDTGHAESCTDDWWSTGQPLMLDFCAGCHSSQLLDSNRFGAPAGVDLETLEGALLHTERIRVRVLEDGDMPPGGGMSTEQLQRLAAWLDCSSQASNPLPSSSSETPLVMAHEFTITVTDQSGWGVLSRSEPSGALWSEEYYLIEGSNVWFGGYSIFNEDLFGVTRAVLFEPMLPLASSQGSEDQTLTVSAEIEEDGVVTTEEQTWSVTTGAATLLDGRNIDRDPDEVVMISDSGEVHVWHLSQTRILSGRWIASPDYLLQALRQDHYSPYSEPDDEPFPFESGDSWQENALLIEGHTW